MPVLIRPDARVRRSFVAAMALHLRELREIGGHIGYDIRPSARQCGHATAMLGAALPVARSLGITRALLTSDEDNIASRKVIEANGGMLEDKRNGKIRYWVPTS
jgi:predicted acetyltransferase